VKRPSLTTVSVGLFAVLWAALLPLRLNVPMSATLQDDAGQYSAAAVHLLQDGMYSLDGVTPYFAREPGMSVWLAGIYAVFGVENRVAVFVLQGLLFLCAAVLFTREFEKHAGKRAAGLSLLLIVLIAPVYHTVFSLYRESLALSLAMLFITMTLQLVRTKRWQSAALAGVLLGLTTLTYTTFLLLPVVLLPLLLFLRAGWKNLVLLMFAFAVTMSPWAIRNSLQTGSMCLTGCNRSAIQWYVRGVQTRDLHGLEPLRCLYSEYISRDWTGRSDACSFNAVMHRKWPDGFKATPEDVQAIADGQKLIIQYLPNYLWLTLTEVLELHLPYVNGWGFLYNLLAAAGMVLIYAGLPWSLPAMVRRSPYALILAFTAVYHTGVFALTDATPRYLLPALFCYTALSGVGYNRILSRIFKWNA
jgi:hypothetical protein